MHPPERITRVFSGTAITASPARLCHPSRELPPPGDCRLPAAGKSCPGGWNWGEMGSLGLSFLCHCFARSSEIGEIGKVPC